MAARRWLGPALALELLEERPAALAVCGARPARLSLEGAVLDERALADEALHERVARRGGRTTLFITGAPTGRRSCKPPAPCPRRVRSLTAAFWEADRRRPGMDLRADDEGHPNRPGSFLMACLFYATITSRDPHQSGRTTRSSSKDVAWDVYRAM